MTLKMIRADRGSIGPMNYRWSSIFAGCFTMLGFGLFFLLLGNAIGLGVNNAVNPGIHGSLKFWSWLYNAVAMIFSYGVGSMLSNRARDIDTDVSAGVHGIVSWGLASVIAAFLFGILSPSGRGILQGVGPDSGNWITVCVLFLGFFSSVVGASIGHAGASSTGVTGEEPLVPTGTTTTVEQRRTGVA